MNYICADIIIFNYFLYTAQDLNYNILRDIQKAILKGIVGYIDIQIGVANLIDVALKYPSIFKFDENKVVLLSSIEDYFSEDYVKEDINCALDDDIEKLVPVIIKRIAEKQNK